MNTARKNREKIHHKRFFEFIQYHRNYKYPLIPNMDPDAALYQDGFFSFQEKREINRVHQSLTALNSDKRESIEKIKSSRIKILANRILARNFNDMSWQVEQTEYSLYMNRLKSSSEKDQIIGYKNDKKLNCIQALEELKETQKALLNPNKDTKRMLAWLKKYIETL